jgi:hypothetical protein
MAQLFASIISLGAISGCTQIGGESARSSETCVAPEQQRGKFVDAPSYPLCPSPGMASAMAQNY